MRKPRMCSVPAQAADEYCLTREDLLNLSGLVQEANDICDYYEQMEQNRLGLLVVRDEAEHDALIDQVETFRDTVLGMTRIFVGGSQH